MSKKDVPTLEIDMNIPCTICGQMGATGSGICLSCAGDQIAGGERLIMESLISASKQLNNLMKSHQSEIHRAYLKAEDGKLSIGLTVELAPSEEIVNAIRVVAKINFIESRVKDATMERVSAQQKFPI